MKKLVKIKVHGSHVAGELEAAVDGKKVKFEPDGSATFETTPGVHAFHYFVKGDPGKPLQISIAGYGKPKWERSFVIPGDGIVAGVKKIELPAQLDPDDWDGPRATA
ncbi:MAG: hypothetical protein ACJ76J_11345 [Thermoanaerobaculia bacterium]